MSVTCRVVEHDLMTATVIVIGTVIEEEETLIATFPAASVYGQERSLLEDVPREVEAEIGIEAVIEEIDSETGAVIVKEVVLVQTVERERIAGDAG